MNTEEIVDKIASFLEKEENWLELRNCWLLNDRSEDLRKLLRMALNGKDSTRFTRRKNLKNPK